MNDNYIVLGRTRILMAEIEVNDTKEKIYYHKYKPEVIANFTNRCIYLHATNFLTNSKKKMSFDTIEYSKLNKVKISLCRRNYGAISAILVNEYHLDITLFLNDGNSYQLESQSWNDFLKAVEIMKDNNVDIIDEMNVIYNYNKSKKDYLKELDSTFDELAVKYNLQHYRGNNIR